MTVIRRDKNNVVVEILERKDDDKGKPIFHPDIYKDLFVVPDAQVGWIFDELAIECKPAPVVVPEIDPELERLLRMEFIKTEFIVAMLVNDLPLQNQLRAEYISLAAQSSAAK